MSGGVPQDLQAHWQTFVAVAERGRQATMQLKAWRYLAAQRCAWEARRVMSELYKDRKDFKVCRLMSAFAHDAAPFFQALGLCPDAHIFHSGRAEAERVAKGLPPVSNEHQQFIRQEFSMSTGGFLIYLLYEASLRKTAAHKRLAKALLLGFCQPWLTPEALQIVDWDSVWDKQVASCCEHDIGGGVCKHIQRAPRMPRQGKGGAPDYLEAMLTFFGQALVCGGAAAGLLRLVRFLAEAAFSDLPARSSCDPYNQDLLRGKKRQLRADEDYKHHVLVTLPRSRQIVAGSMALACDTQIRDESRGRVWLSQQLNSMLNSAWHQLEQHGALRGPLSITEDCARLGNPAQETAVMAVWIDELQCGRFLPPQAVGCIPQVAGLQKAPQGLPHRAFDLSCSATLCQVGRFDMRLTLPPRHAIVRGRESSLNSGLCHASTLSNYCIVALRMQ